VNEISTVLEQTQLPPAALKLELTETAVMEHPEKATRMLAQLKQLGVTIALDDFGTGYASLSYLQRFPIDTLKIDGSFIRGMRTDAKKAEIVQTVISLAKSLQMDVIAECVETVEDVNQLGKLGCALGQGYFFARPLPADKAQALVQGARPWRDPAALAAPAAT
jgi:EAL domain-containing protein (putative c-di-GMP-specific phosphodiesterase class I)